MVDGAPVAVNTASTSVTVVTAEALKKRETMNSFKRTEKTRSAAAAATTGSLFLSLHRLQGKQSCERKWAKNN